MKVLGQKLKHDRGLPGVSRAKAITKRKGTLLQEFKLMNKSNKFLDKRIGERNTGLTEDDRAMARYAAVRIKAHKKASIFNLANDEVLTHKGQTLNEIEKFDDPKSDDDDSLNGDNTGKLESDFVGDAHFGGGVLTNTGSEGFKSHKDMINQLIAESKKRKAEKQKAKERTLELTEKLDEEWKDLIPLVNQSVKKMEEKVQDKSEIDEYDKVMRELRFEARGQPTDRLKSEDEIAKEEKDKLEKLERERVSRMKGVFEDTSITVVPHRSADDLDDDFVYDSEPEVMLTYNEKGESNIKIDKSPEEEDEPPIPDDDAVSDESEDIETASEDDLSDLKDDSSSDDGEEVEENSFAQNTSSENSEIDEDSSEYNSKVKDIKTDLMHKKKMMEKARQELPYTFKLPESYQELQELLKDQSPEYHSVILERMIKCNHPSLAESNKEKLGLLFVYLLQYINDLNFRNDIRKCFKIFGSLMPYFFDLSQMNQENAQNSILEVIKEKQKEYRKNKKRYPNHSVLLFLKLISCLFPTSDFRHPVVTPSIVFIDQMLFKCRSRSRRDIAYGFFLVTLVLEYTYLSKRYLPSAINFLGGLLHMAIPKTSVQLIKVLHLLTPLKLEPDDLNETEISEDFKIRILYNSLRAISEFNQNFKDFTSNKEIFTLINKYLELIPVDKYNDVVRDEMKNLVSSLKEFTDKKLDYIMAEVKRPKALRLYEPNIQKVYDVKRHKVLSKEKAEQAKLLHKIKMEKKGALREIRRDQSFLGRIKIKERIQSDKQRQEKVKRIFAEANVQQSELNAMDRKNKRK
ncbi:hypothetical protein FQR65_LT11673 [Abscondita terminalis]|nr:hypothetical protein FQR65_LT11673 [Abscondita terminalis]